MMNKVILKRNNFLLFSFVAGLSLLLILRDVNDISISRFIFLGFIVALMTVANYQTVVKMLCFMLPLICGLPGTFIMPCVLVLLIFKRKKIKLMQVIPILLLFVLELFAAFWYIPVDYAMIVHYISFVAVLFFLIHDDELQDYQQCTKLYVLGSVLLCGVIIFVSMRDLPSNWMSLFAAGHFRIGATEGKEEAIFMRLTLNPNALGYYSVIGIACCLLLIDKQRGPHKLWYVAAAVLFAVAGFLTVSRSWALVAVGCLFLYIISKLKNAKQFALLIFTLFALTIVTVLYLDKNPDLLAGFESRFTDDTVDSGGNRTYIFKEYVEIWQNNLRFMISGAGVAQYMMTTGGSGAIHNSLQQILVCCGLVGFAIYMVAMIVPVWKARKTGKKTIAHWLPLICLVVFSQTGQILNPTMLILPYIICVYALRLGTSVDTQGVEQQKINA